jgi:hypothetical protein
MQDSSVTPSSHRLAATPALEYTFSSSSSSHGGGQGGGEPPPLPKFNLPDSFWTQHRAQPNAERLLEQARIDFIARNQAQSHQGQEALLKAIENHQEDRENDPRSRIQSPVLHLLRPLQFPDLVLPPEIFVELVVLKDPDSVGSQPESSTSSTSTTTAAAQYAVATGGCCLPPGCNIV